MTYKEYLEGCIGKAGSLFHDHGIYYIRYDKTPGGDKGPVYKINEVHDDFVIIRTENAEVVNAENLTYVIPTSNIYILAV